MGGGVIPAAETPNTVDGKWCRFWPVDPTAPDVPPLETADGGGGLASLLIGGKACNLAALLIFACSWPGRSLLYVDISLQLGEEPDDEGCNSRLEVVVLPKGGFSEVTEEGGV